MNNQVDYFLAKIDKIDLQSGLGFPVSVKRLFSLYDSTSTEIETMIDDGSMLRLLMIGINAMFTEPPWVVEELQLESISDVNSYVGDALFELEQDGELPDDIEIAGIEKWIGMRPYELWKHADASRRMLSNEEETFWNLLSEECFVLSFMESARAWHMAFVSEFLQSLVPIESFPMPR